MTRDPRADELLRDALASLGACGFIDGAEDTGDAFIEATVEKIRAHLAEPQSEPEYVWRATADARAESFPDQSVIGDEFKARMAAEMMCVWSFVSNVKVEHAQIGPWEVVS